VQQNQPALRDHSETGQKMQSRLLLLCAAVIEPDARSRISCARSSAYSLSTRESRSCLGHASIAGFEATPEELTAAAMDVALELVGERTSRRS